MLHCQPSTLCHYVGNAVGFASTSLHLERKKACHGIFLTTILIGREATVFIIIIFFFYLLFIFYYILSKGLFFVFLLLMMLDDDGGVSSGGESSFLSANRHSSAIFQSVGTAIADERERSGWLQVYITHPRKPWVSSGSIYGASSKLFTPTLLLRQQLIRRK